MFTLNLFNLKEIRICTPLSAVLFWQFCCALTIGFGSNVQGLLTETTVMEVLSLIPSNYIMTAVRG